MRPTLFHNNHSWEGENPLTLGAADERAQVLSARAPTRFIFRIAPLPALIAIR